MVLFINNYHTTPCNNPEDHRFQGNCRLCTEIHLSWRFCCKLRYGRKVSLIQSRSLGKKTLYLQYTLYVLYLQYTLYVLYVNKAQKGWSTDEVKILLIIRTWHSAVFEFQERGRAEHRDCEATATSVPYRSLTIVHADQRAFPRSDEVMPAVPGSYGWRREGCQGRHRRVPVAVQAQKVELLNGAWQHRVRAHAEDRWVEDSLILVLFAPML